MDADEAVAQTPGSAKATHVPAITDADVEHNPFPRAQPAAAANKKGAAALASDRRAL
jgi:hypothetical protein